MPGVSPDFGRSARRIGAADSYQVIAAKHLETLLEIVCRKTDLQGRTQNPER
jgi:hypothetical protein